MHYITRWEIESHQISIFEKLTGAMKKNALGEEDNDEQKKLL